MEGWIYGNSSHRFLGSLWISTENIEPWDAEYSVGFCRGFSLNNFNLWSERDYRIYANSSHSLLLSHFCWHDLSLARNKVFGWLHSIMSFLYTLNAKLHLNITDLCCSLKDKISFSLSFMFKRFKELFFPQKACHMYVYVYICYLWKFQEVVMLMTSGILYLWSLSNSMLKIGFNYYYELQVEKDNFSIIL